MGNLTENIFKKEIEVMKKKFYNESIIKGEIEIEEGNTKQRIINSFENVKRETPGLKTDNPQSKLNEQEIIDCDIFINDKKIDFNYYYIFPKKGKYSIKYIFKDLMASTYFMFYRCNSLISLDLSRFNTQNVINMKSMFKDCNSLKTLDLSNFNTKNVKDMGSMFCGCNSLISLDLSNFNTQNTKNISYMFYGCNSLISLDLSKFNIQNVKNMKSLFCGCKSLIFLNLFDFNTKNMIDMEYIFYGCNSLVSLDLSKINNNNVNKMFNYSNSLIYKIIKKYKNIDE